MARIPPMEFLGPAVRHIRKEKKLTLEAVANQVPGYDSGNMSRFERGVQSIDADKLQEIANILGFTVSEIYARAEELETLNQPPSAHARTTAPAPAMSGAPPSHTMGSVLAYPRGDRLQTVAEDLRRPYESPSSAAWEFVLIPSVLVTTDASGRSTITVDQTRPPQPVPRSLFENLGIPQARARFVTVKGDAMRGVLADGDLALLDVGDTAVESGRVYALLVQDEIWLRRVTKTPTGIVLVADNRTERFDDYTLTVAEFKTIEVIGRVRMRWGSSGL